MKRLIKLILPAMLMVIIFTAPVDAASVRWQSSANSYSNNVTYTLNVTPVRTGETKARVTWSLSPSWTSGGEGHGSPTRITATMKCGSWSKTVVIKNSGSNTLYSYNGTFDLNVGAKDTNIPAMTLSASGSGSYQVPRQESYTYYTTEVYYTTEIQWYSVPHYTSDTYYYACNRNGRGMVGPYASYSGAHRYANNAWGKYGYVSSRTSYSMYYERRSRSVTVRRTRSVRHTGVRTVIDTFKTNSGTLSTRSITAGGMEKYYYISYDAVGGKPTPATHGFIGGQSTRISSTKPLYYCEDIKSDGYRQVGWSTTRYNPNSGSPDSRYDAGDTYSARADLKLYAVYVANQIGPIVYHANGGNPNSVPGKQNKYYNVDIQLSTKIPTHPEVTNKGQRYYFLCWNTKADGTGLSYNAGSTFALNKNPHEPLPQVNKGINLYAIWYKGEDLDAEGKNDQTTPNIRYIDKEHQDSLTENSKWKTGVRQTELEDSLNKDGQKQAKRVYDSEGNVVRENP